MKSARLWTGLLLCVLLLIVVAGVVLRSPDKRSAKLHSPELEYLKSVNSVAPPKDPELMFILMSEFANSNLQDEGAEFFASPGIRTPTDSCSEVFVSGNQRLAASSECIESATNEALRVRKRHDYYARPGEAVLRRTSVCRELDGGHRTHRTSRLLSPAKGCAGRTHLVYRARRKSASSGVVARSLLSSRQTDAEWW